MANTAKTLNELVKFLTEERRNKDQAIKEILLTNHPAFQRLRLLLTVPYRVFFTNRDELHAWLKVRSFHSIAPTAWDDDAHEEWINESDESHDTLLKIAQSIFDENDRLKVYTSDEWEDKWIRVDKLGKSTLSQAVETQISDDDIPF